MRMRPNRKADQDEQDTVAHDLLRIREKKGKTCDSDSAIGSLLGLPSDMILEILSRTASLQTLDVLKTVSMDCRHVIYSPGFASAHCHNTKSLYGYFIQGLNLIESNCGRPFSRSLSMFFSFEQPHSRVETEGITLLASCYQGIVLCEKWDSREREYNYLVGKPETLNWEVLPNPNPKEQPYENFTFATGIVVLGSSTPLWFKVVRLVCVFDPADALIHKTHTVIKVETFNSKLGSWREKHFRATQQEIRVDTRGVLIHGISDGYSIYWLNHDDKGLLFNGYDESLNKIHLPNSVIHGACEYKRFQEFQGRLGLVVLTKDCKLELHQLAAGGSIWSKRMEVNLYHLQTRHHFTLFGFPNGEIVYMKSEDVIVFYDLNNFVLKRQVKLDSRLESACTVFQYRSV